ncbi:MAG: hypothetical protein EA366_02660 [Spirulina sp. DLM2.Bin59]|nr:MAG: hypothetical protein EA366_02660 [Spirulina sp. DLM2.Bin59]
MAAMDAWLGGSEAADGASGGAFRFDSFTIWLCHGFTATITVLREAKNLWGPQGASRWIQPLTAGERWAVCADFHLMARMFRAK